MLRQAWTRFHDWLYRPRLDWIQVEITTDCNARCIYCPSAVRGTDWPRKHMPVGTFRKLLPVLARSAQPSPWRRPLIHLQGWGEPLTHPDFFTMVAMVKESGCDAGTTTNGTLIDDEVAERLVASGIDLVSFSVAGTTARNDAARRGTRLARTFDAVDALARNKREAGSATPAVHLSYMLLRSGLDDVERIPDLFADRGIGQIVASTLTFVPDPALAGEAILPGDETEYRSLNRRLAAVAERAAERGLDFQFHVPRPGPTSGLCLDNVQAALVVTVDGLVSPCVLSRFAADGDARPADDPFVFGDLSRDSLADIWWRDAYVAFRRRFWDGAPPARCLACAKLGRS